tara:strand:- start:15766 stop:16071 length:306 start_codon:yes stop_codon:yes gene_type:complete
MYLLFQIFIYFWVAVFAVLALMFVLALFGKSLGWLIDNILDVYYEKKIAWMIILFPLTAVAGFIYIYPKLNKYVSKHQFLSLGLGLLFLILLLVIGTVLSR